MAAMAPLKKKRKRLNSDALTRMCWLNLSLKEKQFFKSSLNSRYNIIIIKLMIMGGFIKLTHPSKT